MPLTNSDIAVASERIVWPLETTWTDVFHVRTSVPFDVPAAWNADLGGYSWSAQTGGRSAAGVFRLDAENRRTCFVKTEITSPYGELEDEIARLRWLSNEGIACPVVLAETREGERKWLLMTALCGRDLASSPDLPCGQIAEIAADALRALHRLDTPTCPFDHRVDRRIAQAQARMQAHLIDEGDFDAERRGRTAADLFQELLVRKPGHEDLVVTHGDACLPNLFADNGRFTGFIDCARLGVADRHQDLALASRSIRYNLGEPWDAIFLERYGMTADPDRLAYYRLLDEFF